MLKPNIKYRVTLTAEERETLQKLIKNGRTAGDRIRHAQILLALDERPANESWSDRAIAAAYGSNLRSIGNIRKRFVEEGFQAALERKKRLVPPVIKIDGAAEAK
ncbi:MAG: helix-turn-helix domain-containing protein, partial [Spirochaetaceae bacterium]|nr:helix-turn-helix domain-containing protein [Spirochaetaceae bacterium]